MVFFREILWFFNLVELAYLEQTAFLPLEVSALKEVFFQILTELLQRNHVLDAPPSNTDGVILRDTCDFSS
jgi:hypothetical protein